MKKKAVLFIAHIMSDEILTRYQKLKNDLSSEYCDVFWALQDDGLEHSNLPNDICFYFFNMNRINQLQYELFYDNTVLCSCNFILQCFFKDFPDYDSYWSIEYDVVFTGNWKTLIEDFDTSDADLISCHIEKFARGRNDYWDWWKQVSWIDEDIPIERRVKAFNPIYCLSKRALIFMDEFLRKGNYGHFETVMSTALYNYGFNLLDMGGTGDFTPPEYINKFYVKGAGVNNGTMRFRPLFLKDEIKALGVKDMLFHPLK